MMLAIPPVNNQAVSSTKPLDSLVDLQREIHAKSRDAHPVGRLMPSFLERRNFEAAWNRVSNTEGARTPGADGVSCADVANRLGPWLDRLIEDPPRPTLPTASTRSTTLISAANLPPASSIPILFD